MPAYGPGSRLGSYDLLSRIGAGGMGEVWKARDTRLDRSVIRVVRIADGSKVPFEIICDIRRRSRILIGRARWMPDGTGIAFVGQDENGVSGIFSQPFVPGRDTTAKRTKLGGFDPEMATDSVGTAPDGSRMMISGWERTWSVMLAERLPILQ